MIRVAITCAKSSMGRPCPALDERIPPADAPAWYAKAIADHGWHVDSDGATYCPQHNPTDAGTVVSIVKGEYRPLGESGWEARLPEDYSGMVHIEIRQQRGGNDG